MKIYVMTDMEGISGINTSEQLVAGRSAYAEGRALLTREINAVARFLKEEGVDEVVVQDGHGSGTNVIWEKLSSDVDLIFAYPESGETDNTPWLSRNGRYIRGSA